MLTKKYITLLMGVLLGFFSNAQDSSKTLKPIIVKSDYDSLVKIAIITSPVPHFKLTTDQLNELGVKDVGEAMKYLPGVQVRDYGGIGGIKTIAYRGIGAGHTAVQIDGNQIANTQTGVVNLSGFETFGVKSIGFSSGENKAEYSTASSFIQVNTIATKSILMDKPKKLTYGLYSNTTSINAYEKGGYLSAKIGDRFHTGIQAVSKFGNGQYEVEQPDLTNEIVRRENTALINYKLRGVFGYESKSLKIVTSGFYENNEQELPGAVVLFNPSNDQKLWNENLRLNSNVFYSKDKWKVQAHLTYQSSYTRYLDPHVLNLDGFIDAQYLNQRSSTGMMLIRQLKRKNERFFVGTDYVSGNLYGNNLTLSPNRFQSNSVLGFSKWVGRFNLNGNVSAQFISDVFDSGNNEQKDRFDLSPFFGFAVLPFKKKAFRLRSFYKQTFRMPSFNDLYYNAIGNSNLKPEETSAFNIGLTYGVSKNKWNGEITADGYLNKVKNKIVAIPTKDLFNWSMQNIGETKIIGLDIAARATYTYSAWRVNLYSNHNFNSSVDVTSTESVTYNNQIPYTPFYSGSNGVSVDYKKISFSSNVLISGFRYSLNENIYANYLPGFTDLNIGLSRKFDFKKNRLTADIKVMNILNKNYQVIRSFPMPGRYYQLRLIFKSIQ